MSDLYQSIAERKIQEAINRGELKELEGRGKPLVLEELNPFEDPEDRVTNRMMKTLGILPEPAQLKKEIEELKEELSVTKDQVTRRSLKKKLEEAEIRYNVVMERH